MGRGSGGGGRGSSRAGLAVGRLQGQSVDFTAADRRTFKVIATSSNAVSHQQLVDNALKRGASRTRSGASQLVNSSLKSLIDAGVVSRSWNAGGETRYSLTPAAKRAM